MMQLLICGGKRKSKYHSSISILGCKFKNVRKLCIS